MFVKIEKKKVETVIDFFALRRIRVYTKNFVCDLGITTQWHYPWICIYEGAIITDALTGYITAIYTSQVIHVQIHNVLYYTKYEQGY